MGSIWDTLLVVFFFLVRVRITNNKVNYDEGTTQLYWSCFVVVVDVVNIVKLKSSLTVQYKSIGLGVDFVFPPSQRNISPATCNISPATHGIYPQQPTTLTKIYQKEV